MSPVFVRWTLVLGLCLGTAPAMAETEFQSVIVHFDDLNLTSAAGQHLLNNRIAAAVTRVCGDIAPRDLAEGESIRTCRTSAMKDATRQIELATASARGAKPFATAGVRNVPSAS